MLESLLTILVEGWHACVELWYSADSFTRACLALAAGLWLLCRFEDGRLARGRPIGVERRATGVVWLPEEAGLGDEVRCPVCGWQRIGTWVICPDCATPHHRDCAWYNAGCAVYGCRPAPGP